MQAIPVVIEKYIDGLKKQDVAQIAAAVADELAFVTTRQTVDKTLFLQMLQALYAGFPDWHYDHNPPEFHGDVIAIKWRQRGTHTGLFSMPGRPPIADTGNEVIIPPQYFYDQVHDDQIATIRPEPIAGGAPLGILEQLGIEMPPF